MGTRKYLSNAVLGIDPGSRRMGLCAMRDGAILELLHQRVAGPTKAERLRLVWRAVGGICDRHQPVLVGIEGPAYGAYPMAAVALAEVRAAATLAAYQHGVGPKGIVEVHIAHAKQAVGCKGNASKSQVQRMVATIFKLDHFPSEDEADAVAIACSAGKFNLDVSRAWGTL